MKISSIVFFRVTDCCSRFIFKHAAHEVGICKVSSLLPSLRSTPLSGQVCAELPRDADTRHRTGHAGEVQADGPSGEGF